MAGISGWKKKNSQIWGTYPASFLNTEKQTERVPYSKNHYKLKLLKQSLKVHLSNPNHDFSHLTEDQKKSNTLHVKDIKAGCSTSECYYALLLLRKFHNINHDIQNIWRRHSIKEWLNDGDINFFSGKKKHCSVNILTSEGAIVSIKKMGMPGFQIISIFLMSLSHTIFYLDYCQRSRNKWHCYLDRCKLN